MCQTLYGIKLHLRAIEQTNQTRLQFAQINDLLNIAINETRELSYELTPSVLRDFGFIEGIKEMVQRMITPLFKIKTTINKSVNALHPELQLYLFRIIQELLNNCVKHANASEVEITVCAEQERVNLRVIDNGNGFNGEIEKALLTGSGMRSIKNRVFLLNGTIDIDTSKGGTKVTIGFKNDIQSFGITLE